MLYNGTFYRVTLKCIVCDAPARQFLKCIAGHCGKGACERCTSKGFHMQSHHCMVFPDLNAPLRTDATFRDQDHPNHHKGTSPFEILEDIDMVNCFALDPMHLVLLGVFKRMLLIWAGKWNRKRKTHALRLSKRNLITQRLLNISHSYPKEFHRVFKAFNKVKRIKAVELRALLLYTGPYVFKSKS